MVKNTEDLFWFQFIGTEILSEFLTKRKSYGIYYGNRLKSHRF